MTRFIPREKLGKKARRKLDNQNRRFWLISPVTKTFESKKQYNRKRKSHDYLRDWNHGIFLSIWNKSLLMVPDPTVVYGDCRNDK